MTNPIEYGTFSNDLTQCSQFFFNEFKKEGRVEDIIFLLNIIEEMLENRAKRNNGELTLEHFLDCFLSESVDDLFLFVSPMCNGQTPIQPSDFKDGRKIPENYTLGQHLQKFPLFSRFFSLLEKRAFQDAFIRPTIIKKINEMIIEQKKTRERNPKSTGGMTAELTIPKLQKTIQKLQEKPTPTDLYMKV